MRWGLALVGLAMIWLGAGAASAAGTIDCAAATSPARSLLCAHPPLVALDHELAGLVDQYAAAYQARPQRVQRLAKQLTRHHRDLDRCGTDVACIGNHYIGWVDWMRKQTGDTPRDWTATRAEFATIADEARKTAGMRLMVPGQPPHPLIGFWRGEFNCISAGSNGPLELVFDAGFAGTVVGFMSAWTIDKGPLDAVKRSDISLKSTEDPRGWTFDMVDSRIDETTPGMSFTSGTIALDEAGTTLTGTFTGRCDAFTLERTDHSEGLDALLAWVGTYPKGRSIWDWPYIAGHFPDPDLFAFCTEAIGWMRALHEDYPEALVARMGADIIADKAINLLDDHRFIALAGKSFDEMTDAERKALDDRIKRGCRQNPIIARSMRWSQGALHALGAREGTHPFDAVMRQLQAVRAARTWRDDALASVAEPGAAAYSTAAALGAQGELQLAALMPGDLIRFNAALAAARQASAPSFARARLASVASGTHDTGTLASLAQAVDELAPAFADMVPAVRDEIMAEARASEDVILASLVSREADALNGFGSGLDAIAAGRRWYGRFMLDFGRYQDRPLVADTLAAFHERRRTETNANAAELVAMIEPIDDKGAFNGLMERYVIAGLDDENAQIGAALSDREAYFQRQELLAGFSPYERSLADANGVIVVPATYPEPTEEEISLAVAREYSQYGSTAKDGSFTYGLIPETSVEMKIISVHKQGCAPASGGGYTCTRVLTMQMGMSRAMQGILGNSIQGQIMQSFLDEANSTRSEVLEDHLVLTPQGWRSNRAAASAARGITNSMQTVTDVVGGVACGLSELADMGGC